MQVNTLECAKVVGLRACVHFFFLSASVYFSIVLNEERAYVAPSVVVSYRSCHVPRSSFIIQWQLSRYCYHSSKAHMFVFLAHKCFISALLKTLYGHRPQSPFIDMSWIGVEKMPSRKKYSSHKVCSNYESFIKGQYCNLVATLKILAHIYRFKQNVQLHESRILPLHAQSYPLCGGLFHSCFW